MTPGTLEPLPPGAAKETAVQPPQTAIAESGFSDFLRMLRKRKWIILACIVLGFAYGWYKYKTQVRVYVASGTIEVGTGSASAFRVGSGNAASATGETPTAIATEVAILKSDSLLLSVARDLDLANNPHFMGGPAGTHLSLDDPGIRQAVIGMLGGAVMVTVVPKTNLVRIACTTGDAKLSADIVNRLVENYRYRSFRSRVDATERAAQFLDKQLRDLKQQVEDSQARLIDLGKTLGIIGLVLTIVLQFVYYFAFYS